MCILKNWNILKFEPILRDNINVCLELPVGVNFGISGHLANVDLREQKYRKYKFKKWLIPHGHYNSSLF